MVREKEMLWMARTMIGDKCKMCGFIEQEEKKCDCSSLPYLNPLNDDRIPIKPIQIKQENDQIIISTEGYSDEVELGTRSH